MNRLFSCAALVVVAGCASVPKGEGHEEVSGLVESKTGHQTGWEAGPPEADAVRKRIREMLEGGLTAEEAVRIALVNSPALLATFEEIGIAQNDMLQATLLSNPSIGVGVGFPNVAGAPPELSFSLVQALLDLAVLPARRSIAQSQFRATVLRVADEALHVVTETRRAFVEVQAAQTALGERLALVAASEAAMTLAKLQFDAGNNTLLDVAVETAAWEEARAQYAREELDLLAHREALIRLLGLWGSDLEWRIAEPLPKLPEDEPALTDLEAVAVRQRLDVAARRQDLELAGRALSLSRSSWLLGRVEVGVDWERESDGLRTVGPTLVLELPIFDQRQALIGGLEAQQRQAERRLTEASVNARSDVRLARARLLVARRLVEHYDRALLPAKTRVLQQTQLQYNAMGLSPYQLFEARRDLASARREYIEAIADYWSARAEIERAVGGPITKVKP